MPIPTPPPGSSPWPTLKEHNDAVKATLLAASARPHGYGEKVTERDFTLFTVSPRFAGELKVGGTIDTRAIRITTLAVGADGDNAYEMQRRVDAALREQVITVGGHLSSPIQFEAGDPVGPDGDSSTGGAAFSASASWTYTV